MYETIISFIKDLGFPIFVAAYLLIIFRKTLQSVMKALEENTKLLHELFTLVKGINSKKG